MNQSTDDTMRDEYDFSKAVRGKFHRPEARIELPIYLEDEIARYLSERAASKGTTLGALVNQLLKKDIELIETGS